MVVKKGKKTTHVIKPLYYCTIEMTLSSKLLFIMLNINDLIIKLFLSLYLVSIYYYGVFINVCAYVYHEYACVYVFLCFPCYLGLTMPESFC